MKYIEQIQALITVNNFLRFHTNREIRIHVRRFIIPIYGRRTSTSFPGSFISPPKRDRRSYLLQWPKFLLDVWYWYLQQRLKVGQNPIHFFFDLFIYFIYLFFFFCCVNSPKEVDNRLRQWKPNRRDPDGVTYPSLLTPLSDFNHLSTHPPPVPSNKWNPKLR